MASSRTSRRRKRDQEDDESTTNLTIGQRFNFIDSTAYNRWSVFCNCPFSIGRCVNFSDHHFHDLFPLFHELSLHHFLSISTIIYPELVHFFYCNLRKVSAGHFISRVRGIDIVLTPAIIAEIFHIPDTGVNPLDITICEAITLTKATSLYDFNTAICRDNNVPAVCFKLSQLNERAKLIVTIISWCLAPRFGRFTYLNAITKSLLIFIWQKHKFNVASFILDFMFSHTNPDDTLPYGMILTPILEYFSMDFHGELAIPPDAPIQATRRASLCDDTGGTSAARDPVPPSFAAVSSSNPALLARLVSVEATLKNLQHDMASINDKLDVLLSHVQSSNAGTRSGL